MSWIFEWWRTKVRVCSWQSSKVVEQSYSWLLTRSRNPRARDSNISRFELVVKLDYMIQSLDCKLLKYKLAFVVFLWPWSVLRHYIKQCTQIISNCYMGTILFTYRVYMYQILHISHQYKSQILQNLINFNSQSCRDVLDYVLLKFANYDNGRYIKIPKSRYMYLFWGNLIICLDPCLGDYAWILKN